MKIKDNKELKLQGVKENMKINFHRLTQRKQSNV